MPKRLGSTELQDSLGASAHNGWEGRGMKSDKKRLRAKKRHNLPKGTSMSTAWPEPRGTQAKLWLRHFQGRSLTWHAAGWDGVGGGRHLCVQENNPLLGNKEVDATGLVAPSLLHFGTLGPENIRPAEEQVGS